MQGTPNFTLSVLDLPVLDRTVSSQKLKLLLRDSVNFKGKGGINQDTV